MNIRDEIATSLNGVEYPPDWSIKKELVAQAKAGGLVIVYGLSDDLMEFDGVFRDEIGCYDGGEAFIDKDGVLQRDSAETDEEIAAFVERKKKARKIEALWCAEAGYSWTYKTDIPHATFEIVEGSETYCRGIVFSIDDLAAN